MCSVFLSLLVKFAIVHPGRNYIGLMNSWILSIVMITLFIHCYMWMNNFWVLDFNDRAFLSANADNIVISYSLIVDLNIFNTWNDMLLLMRAYI